MRADTPRVARFSGLVRVARKYGLGISTYYGESYYTLWGVPVASKSGSARINGIDEGSLVSPR